MHKKQHLKSATSYQQGFTLIELMVTLAIATIIVLIAVPSFTTLIKNNRIIANSNTFISAISLARTEATKRGQTITLTSSNGTTWDDGWNINRGGTVIRNYEAFDAGTTLTSTVTNFSFDSRGALSGASSLSFKLCDDRTNETGIEIKINATGKPASLDYSSC